MLKPIKSPSRAWIRVSRSRRTNSPPNRTRDILHNGDDFKKAFDETDEGEVDLIDNEEQGSDDDENTDMICSFWSRAMYHHQLLDN
jgi:hypothetical protein